MTTFDEQVDAGVRAMFAQARTGVYADMEFDEIPEEHREFWRHNFAIGYRAALSEVLAQSPQYRIRFLPRNSDGERGVWYTGTPYGYEYKTEAEAFEVLGTYEAEGVTVRMERRWVTEWTEVES